MSTLFDVDNAKNLQEKATLLKEIVRTNEVDPMVLGAYLKRQMNPSHPRAWADFCSKIQKYVNQQHPSAMVVNHSPSRAKTMDIPHENPFQMVEVEDKNPLLRYLSYMILGVAVVGAMFSMQNQVSLSDLPQPNKKATSVVAKALDKPVVSETKNIPVLQVSKAVSIKKDSPNRGQLSPLTLKGKEQKPLQSKQVKEGVSVMEEPVALPQRATPLQSARNQANQSTVKVERIQMNPPKPRSLSTAGNNNEAADDIPAEAREAYVKALVGDAQSQALIASFYDEGHILSVDPQKALHWYTKAGENGHAGAQNHLGVVYFKGIGVPRDHKKASYWWTYAAKQGFAPAQNNLGYLYEKGLGVKQNYMTAAYWYNKSANQDYAQAQNNLAVLLDQGRGIQKNSEEAIEWWIKSANQGYAKAQNNLGVMYFQGRGVDQNVDEALKWWHKAARQDYARAQNNLGILYEEGEGVPRDLVMSYAWLSRAFVNGYDESGVYRAEMEKVLSPSQLSMAQELIYGDINLMPGMRQWAGPELHQTKTASIDPF